MRQLLYHWQFANDVFYSTYDETLEKISYDFSKTNWPVAGQPFSIFTSSYGTAGKTLQTGFGSNKPTKNWDRKQISQPPKVAADQFVVLNNVSSTPGVLPIPTITETNSGWEFTFEIFVKKQSGIPTIFIWDLEYLGITGSEPATFKATAERLQDATKSYYDPTLVKATDGSPTGFVLIAQDYLDITKIYKAFLDPLMVFDVKVTPPTGVIASQGITTWTVTFSLPRFGVTQPAPTVSTTFAPSKVDRRRTVEATRTDLLTLGKYYENINPNGFVQLVINDTNYFQEPIHTQALGVSGDAAPFPQQVGVQVPHWSLKPNFYVLPGQTWDVKYTTMNDIYALEDYIAVTRAATGNPIAQIGSYWTYAEVFLSYYIFEGANAMICHQLLKLGITINPDSVNWYKQQILEMEGLDPKTYEVYLDLQREWQAKQKRLDDHYLRGRKK